jgi:hypothetical protein
MAYFCEADFQEALKAYHENPTAEQIERIAVDFILPVARGFCFSRFVIASNEDREDFAQMAAIRCLAKLHLLYRNGYKRAHPYLTKIVQNAARDEQARLNRARMKAASQIKLSDRLGLATPPEQAKCAGRRAIDNVAKLSSAHAAAIVALTWLPNKGKAENRVARALGIPVKDAREIVADISAALVKERGERN